MREFFKRFRAAWNYAKFFRYTPEADNWSQDDAVNAHVFFSQGTGARLLFRLRNIALTNSLQAAIDGDTKKAAQAAGIVMTIANINSHFQSLIDQAQAEQESPQHPPEHARPTVFSGP